MFAHHNTVFAINILVPHYHFLSGKWTLIDLRTVSWSSRMFSYHDDVIKWNYFPRYWPFVRGIHRWPMGKVNSPHKGQLHGALMFSLICARMNGWVNNRGVNYLRRHRAHYDVTVMWVMRENRWICSLEGPRNFHHKVWDEIVYSFPNFKGAAVEVWEWISNIIPHFTGHVITFQYWDWS